MRSYTTLQIITIICIATFLSCIEGNNSKFEGQTISGKEQRAFELLDVSRTGITFVNLLKDQQIPSHIQYVNVFNGGGVSVGDVNNDGFQDLYFTGNKVGNKLYLNKGNFEFEDITESAGVGAEDSWSNGAVFTDINNDGFEDIYLSCALYFPAEKRENKLFINQGDNTFIEEASSYGINDNGFSIQSVFFDYDGDGDNDLIVGNHPLKRNVPENIHIELWHNPPLEVSDKLFRNNGDGTFTDVTKEAGIANYGWTLSIITSDFNDDNLADIFIASDYGEPDRLFINNGDGTFIDKVKDTFKHLSMSSMGSDLADINNDGFSDLFTAEMLSTNNYGEKTQMASMNPGIFKYRVNAGYHQQFMRNMLQLKTAPNGFSEIGQMAGVHRSDWSWSALFFDFDNNTTEDLYISNGYYFDIFDKDFLGEFAPKLANAQSLQDQTFVLKEAYEMVSSTPTQNKLYSNNGDLTFDDVTMDSGTGYESFSSGAVYVDLDNNGFLDIVTNNLDMPPFVFKNISPSQNHFVSFRLSNYLNQDPVGSRITLYLDNQSIKAKELIRARGYASSVSNVIHFGLGDSIEIVKAEIKWPNGVLNEIVSPRLDQLNILSYSTDKLSEPTKNAGMFVEVLHSLERHLENEFDDYKIQVLLPHMMSRLGPFSSVGDINDDGYDDVFIGGSRGTPGQLYVGKPGNQFERLQVPALEKDKIYEDMGSIMLDVDGDTDLDLFIASGGNEFPEGHAFYQDRLYLNEDGHFVRARGHLPANKISSGRVDASDFDKDGDLDIFVSGRQVPHQYPYASSSIILVNNGSGIFTDATEELCPALSKIGMITDGKWADINDDGLTDLVIAGEWTPIHVFIQENGRFIQKTEDFMLSNNTGWWNVLKIADIDKDGDNDIIAGNLGMNYKYQASDYRPFHIYSDDLDNSGSVDIVLGYYFNDDIIYPVRGKQCSSEQIPSLSKKFDSYKEFASLPLSAIYGSGLDNAIHYEAKEFRSGIFLNEDQKFSFIPFPNYAQMAPINGIAISDFNKDDNLDLVVGGNLYSSEIETGRADAGKGLLLIGEGAGNFRPIPSFDSGIMAEGDVKDVDLIRNSNLDLILFTRNHDYPLVFSIRSEFK